MKLQTSNSKQAMFRLGGGRAAQIGSNSLRYLFVLLFASAFGMPSMFALEKEAHVRLGMTVFSIDRTPIKGLFYSAPDGTMEELQFSSRRRSQIYPYEGPQSITFYKETIDQPSNETVYLPVASAKVEQRSGEVLVFFLRNNNGPESSGFKTLAMDDSEASFPNGHIRVLNASGAELHGRLGNQDISLQFEISEPLSHQSIMRGQQSWVEVAFVLRIREAFELVYANQLTFSPTDRSILVLRPPRRSRSIQINTFLLEDSAPSSQLSDDRS